MQGKATLLKKIISINRKSLFCAISQEKYPESEGVHLPCGDFFEKKSLSLYITSTKKPKCPCCRTPIENPNFYIIDMHQFVTKEMPNNWNRINYEIEKVTLFSQQISAYISSHYSDKDIHSVIKLIVEGIDFSTPLTLTQNKYDAFIPRKVRKYTEDYITTMWDKFNLIITEKVITDLEKKLGRTSNILAYIEEVNQSISDRCKKHFRNSFIKKCGNRFQKILLDCFYEKSLDNHRKYKKKDLLIIPFP